MKRNNAFALILAVGLAAARLSSGPATAVPNTVETRSGAPFPKAATRSQASTGEYRDCTAYDPLPDNSPYPHDENKAAATSVINTFFAVDPAAPAGLWSTKTDLHYALALVPDPLHTNLSLTFDREMVAIQEAAQDDGYTYNSNWLPWALESQSFPLLVDQQEGSKLAQDREACPGILLFRGSKPASSASEPQDAYGSGLVVLVVGEQPTGGVNEDQWANAIHWLATNASQQKGNPRSRIFNLLGPSFSGSLVSLDRDLGAIYQNHSMDSPEFVSKFNSVSIMSGNVSACGPIQWFRKRLSGDLIAPGGISFRSFRENDELNIYRFFSYLLQQGGDASDTAILSEDETAYGSSATASPTGKSTNDAEDAGTPNSFPCEFPYPADNRPVWLYYPRDISGLRAAYQEQSIFRSPGPAGADHPYHAILHAGTKLNEDSADITDTIQTYSGQRAAIAQEAVMYGIVSYLRAHHTRYLVLRSTNPLDSLFLTRFFHRAYPEARIVTMGADLLFRREIDTTEFRGVLALSNYPLLPRNQHWSALVNNDLPERHAHRAFESQDMEGSYLAGRYLFGDPAVGDQLNHGSPPLPFMPLVPDFADPYWLHSPPDTPSKPPTWLEVVGVGGYWPLAVLNDHSTPPLTLKSLPAVHASPPSSIAQVGADPHVHYDQHQTQFSMSLPWNICAVLAVLLLIYQTYGVAYGTNRAATGLFAVFRTSSDPAQSVLLGMNSALAFLIPLVLLSTCLIPLNAGLLAFKQPLMWIACLSVCGGAYYLSAKLHSSQRDLAALFFWIVVMAGLTVMAIVFFNSVIRSSGSNGMALFYRASHVTSVVSPLLPTLLLLTGLYLWTWQAMAGNLMLSDGCPLLPKLGGNPPLWNELPSSYFRISDRMEQKITGVASPLSTPWTVMMLPLYIAAAAILLFWNDVPLLSLESHSFAICINLGLLFAFLLTSAEALRLFSTWLELRRLLTSLGRLRLRRTFARLNRVDFGSLWGMSGNVQRVQYLFFARQFDAARRLQARLGGYFPSLDDVLLCGRVFAEQYASKLDQGQIWEKEFKHPCRADDVKIRMVLNDAVAQVLNSILLPVWRTEENSLSIATRGPEDENLDKGADSMHLSDNPAVCDAEEFVCFHYISYIQNVLARMRTMVLSMGLLFVAVCFAISVYPFVPRTQISLWLIINLLCIGTSVIYVYAGLERDEILSYITDTMPGRLGGEFWFKTAAFFAGPLIGILTTQYPAIADSVLAWVQPGLDAIK
jgi:hypothetical protein